MSGGFGELTLMLRGSLLWMRGWSCSCSRGRALGGSRRATRTSCVTVTRWGTATHSPASTPSPRGRDTHVDTGDMGGMETWGRWRQHRDMGVI